jgi:4-amino-4-deoxy-L-arabinose transferase-like glycosyltransferase
MVKDSEVVIPERGFEDSSERKFFIVLWAAATLTGFLQSWAERFYLEPDGVNYLDVAYAYLRHDYHNAVNAYWSPLYSWLLALIIAVTHTTPYWESTILHALNFFIYLFSLICFSFFFREVTLLTGKQRIVTEKKQLSRSAWNLFGYLLFVYASLELIGVGTDTPDMLVFGFCFLATGILLRMRAGGIRWRIYFTLGLILALAYLSKAVMFPISCVFLACCGFAAGNWRKTTVRTALALLTFLVIASPWLYTLTKAKGRPTFGDTGRLNYAYYVNGLAKLSHWHGEISGAGTPLHGTHRLSETPPVEAFATPIAGTYPPWYDSTYWDEGVRPHFESRGQLHALSTNLGEYFRLLSAQKGIAVGLLLLILFSGRERQYWFAFMNLWPVWLPAVATLGLYALVHVEARFLGAAIVILWCTLFAAVQLPRSESSESVWAFCLIAVSASLGVTLVAQSTRDVMSIVNGQRNVEWEVAQAMTRHGVQKGDLFAVLGHSNEGDYWAHLVQGRIVAEVPTEGVSDYWDADSKTRLHVLNLLSQSGAHFLVSRIPPPPSQTTDWERLSSTGYYVLTLPKLSNSN